MSHSRRTPDSRRRAHKLHITHSTLIHADLMNVYTALATSRGLDSWFTTRSTVDAVPGGEIHFRWVDWGPDHITAEDCGVVLEAIPSKRFVFQ